MSLQVIKTGDDGQVLNTALTLTGVSITGGSFISPTIDAPALTSARVNPLVSSPANASAIALSSAVNLLSHTSAGAYSVAAPGVAGLRITFTTTTDFAHVVTFTGGTLWDGTAGANTTWTSAAVQGSSLTVVSVSATKWNVESFNLGTIAP
jgi:hypothetical protein